MAREKKGFNPEAWTPEPDKPKLEVMDGGKESAETPMEERKLEHYLLTCKEGELQLLKEYLATYQRTDTLFDSMRKAKEAEKAELKKKWSSAKEALDFDFLGLSKELRNLLEAMSGFGRKQTMRGLEFLVVDITGRRGEELQKAITHQADADKTRVREIHEEIDALPDLTEEAWPTGKNNRRQTARRRTHAIPHVEDGVKPATQRAGWFKRNARRVALALLPFIGGGAVGTSVLRKGEEVAKPAGVTDTMREEELPPMPLKSRVEIPEDEAEVFESKKPACVVTRAKIRQAVERKTARERHETSAGRTQTEGRSRDLYENLQKMDPTGAGTHVPLSEGEIRMAAKEARDRVLGNYGVSEDNDDSQVEGGPQASR